jgi:thioredoxin reductase (NADPH)
MVDYIIIGGGFSGLFLKKLFDENNISSLLVDGENLGGQLNLYLNKYIYDIPGILKISGQELLDDLKKSIDLSTVITNGVVKKIIYENDKKILMVEKNNQWMELKCKYIISAMGKGIVEPVIFNYPGLDEIKKHNKLFYHLNNKSSNKVIAILGGGDGALDAAEYFLSLNCMVHVVHRRNITGMVGKFQNIQDKTYWHLSTNIENFEYLNPKIKIILKKNEEIYEISVDEVYMFYGLVTKDEILVNLLGKKKLIVDPSNMKSEGLVDYAIGDGAIYDNNIPLSNDPNNYFLYINILIKLSLSS